MLPQGSLQITLTEAQRKMVVRSLATTIENLRSYPGESILDFELQKWMGLIAQFATAKEASAFVPLIRAIERDLLLRRTHIRRESKMKKLIAGALIVCVTIGVVAWAIIRHVNNKQNALWCLDHGYTNYATKDGFCVGAGGKLIKVGL